MPIDGSRFAGQLPPVVPAPTFAIRKKAVAIFTLDQYVEAGIMTAAQQATLTAAIKAHRNILVIGGTGSGKTTLVNAIINAMVEFDPAERVFIIEDTGEIQCAAENFVQYHTWLEVTMTVLLKTTLRMRPDRIVVGECRGGEALDMLQAMNTGHEGSMTTLHANSPRDALARLETLVLMAGMDLPLAAIREQIASAATNGTASLAVGVAIKDAAANGRAKVVVYGIAENVPAAGAVAAGDILKRSATTAGYVSATASPAAGEAIGIAINASSSNAVDMWVCKAV